MDLFKKSEDVSNYKNLTLKVSGMSCERCNQNIERNLSKIKGVRNVKADFQKGEAKMEYDVTKVRLEKIRNTIRKIGFMPGAEQIG